MLGGVERIQQPVGHNASVRLAPSLDVHRAELAGVRVRGIPYPPSHPSRVSASLAAMPGPERDLQTIPA
jgi:hypothetical protein